MPQTHLSEKIINFFKKSDKRSRVIFILGLVGILLIGISQFWPFQKNKTSEVVMDAASATEDYKSKLEERVKKIISSIEGVGKAQVMVTLESGIEYVYEKEQNVSSTLNEDSGLGAGTKVQQSVDSKESFIIIEDENGHKTALVRTRLEPKVQGGVIVCEGGGSALVAKNIYDLVTTALGIGYDRVCVVKSN